jgi:hypothetical protein
MDFIYDDVVAWASFEQIPDQCHPERSEPIRSESVSAQSKDPYLLQQHAFLKELHFAGKSED